MSRPPLPDDPAQAGGGRGGLRARLTSPLGLDMAALYGLQLSAMLIPVLTLPVLSRVLTPEQWAALLVAQAAGLAITTLVEYGHNLTATRAVAASEGPAALGRAVGLTLGSKAALALVALLLTALAAALGWGPGRLLWVAALFGVIQGSVPIWYFQGRERARVAALTDMGFKVSFAALMVVGVSVWRTPDAALWIQTLGLAFSWAVLHRRIRAELSAEGVPVRWPTFREVTADLRRAFPVFAFRFMGASYTSALALVLALVARPAEVALLLAADRIAKVLPVLSVPLCQALFPRISRSGAAGTARGMDLVARLMLLSGAAFVLGGAVLFALRTELTALLLDPRYSAAAGILSYSLWLMPFIAFNTFLLQLWAFPTGRDRLANAALLVNAGVTLGWVLLMYGRLDFARYAAGVTLGEVAAFLLLLLAFVRTRRRLAAAA